jgi:hemoglobin-like flavoprotein
MSLNVALLRSSFELVTEREPQLTVRFYEILFDRYPQVKPLFGRSSGGNQAAMLQSALVSVLERIEDAAWLESTLRAMGDKHVDYGVTEEMYSWVGDSLISAIGEAAGDAWSRELEAAWLEAYAAISGLMRQGAQDRVIAAQ